jgi:hypothetical protein
MSDESLPSSLSVTQNKAAGRFGTATAAGLLSLIIAGMGQLYNRQPRKALWLTIPIPIVVVLSAQTRILFYFAGMAALLVILISWRLFIAIEAGYCAWKAGKP